MRNLLALLAAVTLLVAGIGLWRGWFSIETTPPDAEGHRNITIDVDTQKVSSDIHKGEEKIHQTMDKKLNQDEKGKHAETARPTKGNKAIPD